MHLAPVVAADSIAFPNDPRPASAGLRRRMIVLVAIGLTVMLLLFGLIGARAIGESIERTLRERLVMAELTAVHLDQTLAQALYQVELAASSSTINLTDNDLAPEKQMLRYTYLRSRIFTEGVFLLDGDGTVLWKEPQDDTIIGADLAAIPFIADALSSGGLLVSSATVLSTGQKPIVLLSSAVKGQDGRITGLVVGGIDLTDPQMGALVRPVKLGKTGYVEVVDENGFVLATTKPEYVFEISDHPKQFARLIAERKNTVSACHSCHTAGANVKTEPDVLAFAPMSVAPWGVAVRQAEAEALAPTHEFQWQFLGLGLGSLLIALLLVWSTTGRLLSRIALLTQATRRIAAGDLDTSAPRMGRDEVGTLAQGFDHMREKVKAARDAAERWSDELEGKVQQRTKELATLLELSTASTFANDVEGVLVAAIRKVVDVFEAADAGALFLHNPDLNRLVCRASVGYDPEPLSLVKLKPGEAILGKSFQSALPLLCATPEEVSSGISDMSEENYRHFTEARTGLMQPQAAVCAPLIFKNKTTGSLVLVNLRRPGTFLGGDLKLVQAVANHIAVIVENARLAQEASEARALREAGRLKDDFLSSVSHELLTPLTSVKAAADLLLAMPRSARTEDATSLMRNIGRNAERLTALVGDLLDLARLQGGTTELRRDTFAIEDVITEAVGGIQPLADTAGQSIRLALPPGRSLVYGDPRRLEQVLVNLLSNASKFTGRGGIITVGAQEVGREVVVSVSDTGPGIPLSEQALVFEKFYVGRRGKVRAKGAGIGLSIAKYIVELHGGRIWVESKLGKGSTFSFSIPGGDGNETSDSG